MNTKMQKNIDETMDETNEKISNIVNEIRHTRFSKINESEKQTKCDKIGLKLEQIIIKEEKTSKVVKEHL